MYFSALPADMGHSRLLLLHASELGSEKGIGIPATIP